MFEIYSLTHTCLVFVKIYTLLRFTEIRKKFDFCLENSKK